jgi:hypothetical protein
MSDNTENNPPKSEEETLETTAETEQAESIGLSDAITGIFTEPGETFTSVKATSKKNFWLIPILIFIVLSIVSRYLAMNDEELYSEVKTKQTEAVKKRLDDAVKEGKMSKEQADERMGQMEKGFNKSSPIFILSITLGPAIFIFVFLFLKGLILFGALKIFKGAITYMQVITVLGLASIIDSIQTIIDTVLAIITGRLMANIGPILIFSKDSLSKELNTLVGHFDVFNIWYLILVGIGLAAFSGLKNKQTIPVVFALWLIWVCLTSFLNLGFFG